MNVLSVKKGGEATKRYPDFCYRISALSCPRADNGADWKEWGGKEAQP